MALARFQLSLGFILLFHSSIFLLLSICIMFDVVIPFMLFYPQLNIYIWVCCCLIPPSYHLPVLHFPPPDKIWWYAMSVPKLSKQSYSYGVYCCVLLFPIILAFHSCHIFSTHCHFNTPPGLVRTNSSPMSCILLYYYISHHGWLLYIISIVGQGRYTYMHQHFTLYITRFEHSATRVRWPRTPSFCHGITKSQQ